MSSSRSRVDLLATMITSKHLLELAVEEISKDANTSVDKRAQYIVVERLVKHAHEVLDLKLKEQ